MNSSKYVDFDLNQIPSPCYVVDKRLLRKNLELIKYVREQADISILLALKGFAMHSTFDLVKQYVDGATASSLHEAQLCMEKMGSKAHLCVPVYTDHEMDEILNISTHITFNSLSQWERFKDKVKNHPQQHSCAIRINPEYSEVEVDLYNPAGPRSRLGTPLNKFGDTLPEGIDGLHFHVLCEQDSYVLERTLKVVEEKFGHLLHQAKWLNMGGGHHITRKDYDVEHLIGLLKRIKSTYNIDIIMEPGEAFGWQTGYLIATVEDLIEHKDLTTAMLDVSFTAHMPDCLEMPYMPKVWGGNFENPTGNLYQLGGGTCLAGDQLGDYSFEEPLNIGDKIIFNDMAHYTMVKTSTFNGVQHPSIGIINEDRSFTLVREFGYEDYRNRLS
ncbi:MAG: carboxynorspermidine decarboxylase [Bacteroidia bacterium]